MTYQLSVSIPETATLMGVSRTTIYELIKDGLLPCVKVGSRTLIRIEAIDQLLKSLEKKGS
jgi:excisionase family DNA binding protein